MIKPPFFVVAHRTQSDRARTGDPHNVGKLWTLSTLCKLMKIKQRGEARRQQVTDDTPVS
jgi:hypothetical protein